MGKLDGKVAIITGGNSGIGLATAKRFIEEGAYVFIVGRRQAELDKAVNQIGERVLGVRADVSKLDDLDRLYEIIKETKGRIDIVFANAGSAGFTLLQETTPELYEEVLDLNLRGVLFTVLKALPLLNDGGSIVMTGSIASVKVWPGLGLYSAAKAAVRALARALTVELKDRRIRTNLVTPGATMTAPLISMSEEFKRQVAQDTPMGRIADPSEIASAVLFLASDESSFISGIELFADGGAAQV